ncbi:MAG: putative cyclic pyranopterin monophosphate synthase accessory protein [Promethearchaeota archaeon CR_4]|nr:MAG: putative cyclic pyranopterin monophosphate synthase accessory protein [Candidatus Lokiarchaeota archaeon CR_4]
MKMVNMIDVSEKPPIRRVAEAEGTILLQSETIELIQKKAVKKGDVQSVAELMGIQGSKLTPQIMPLCHPIPVESTRVTFKVVEGGVTVTARVTATAKTGVEMEALTAVTVALLNVWDMVKMYEKDDHGQYPHTQIMNIKVNHKEKS